MENECGVTLGVTQPQPSNSGLEINMTQRKAMCRWGVSLSHRVREIKDSESMREVEREGEKEIEGVERERLSLKKIFFV